MRRRRTLIVPPLEWQLTSAPVPHPVIPALAERGGTQLHTPRPVALVDTREQNPLDFSRFEGWFASTEAFEDQLERGLITCPVCSDDEVTRLPSGPRVLSSSPAKELANHELRDVVLPLVFRHADRLVV